MTVWILLALALVACVASIVLRQSQPAYATALTILVGALLFCTALQTGVPLVHEMQLLLERSAVGKAFSPVLMKALGIGLLSQTAADVCRDVGESALANKVELGGKVLLLVSALPLVEYTVTLLDSVISGQAVMP